MVLKKKIEELTAEVHKLIVEGDFNPEYEDLKYWMIGLDLIDLIGKKQGKKPQNSHML